MADTLLSDDDVGLGSPAPAQSSDASLMSDSDLGISASPATGGSTTSGTGAGPGLSSGETYRPGPNFSALGDLWGDIQGQKPQNVVSASAPTVPPEDTRNPAWAAVADIPSEIGSAASGAWQGIKSLNPISPERQAANAALAKGPGNPSFFGGMGQEAEQTLGTGEGLLSIPGAITSPITGINRSVTGHTLAATGLAQNYQQGKDEADILMSAIAPGRKAVAEGAFNTPSGSPYSPSNPPRGPVPQSPPVPGVPASPVGDFGVVRTKGDITGDTGDLQTEQAARQGDMGEGARKAALASDEQKAAQVSAATNQVQGSLDPTGEPTIDFAHEAGNLASQRLQVLNKASEDNIDAKYTAARAAPGAFNTEDFDGKNNPTVASSVRSVIKNQPGVVYDPAPGGLTPGTNAALGYLREVPELQPEITPPPEGSPEGTESTVTHKDVPLATLDQIRRNLGLYRNTAWRNSPTDGTAASAVVDAFDNHFANLADNGGFTGPDESLQAWNTARAANAAHQQTFGVGTNDPVGRTIQQILGTENRMPLTGNDVADKMFGASGTNPASNNVDLTQHLQGIFGADSPEMSAIRQGQFSRLTGESGGTPWGHKKVYDNIDKFLNRDGKEMSNTLYSPAQKSLIQSYGDMRKSLIPKEGTRNSSVTSPFVNRVIHAITGNVASFVGAALGQHFFTFLPEVIREAAGAASVKGAGKMNEILQANKIKRMMPTTTRAIQQWETAAAKASNSYLPQTRRALIHTSGRLANALAPLGVSLKSVLLGLQGPGVGYANPPGSQNQNQVPGPEGQQKNPGNPGSQNGFAKGGRVQVDLNPTEAQKAVGNYKKYHTRIHGLDVSIENLKGSYRSGVGNNGKKWQVKIPHHYGYIRGTTGADSDHVDCYLGPDDESNKVFVIDQRDLKTNKFDEHKCMLGFKNREAAIGGYINGFSDDKGQKRIQGVTEMTPDKFKEWLESGKTKEPLKKKAT